MNVHDPAIHPTLSAVLLHSPSLIAQDIDKGYPTRPGGSRRLYTRTDMHPCAEVGILSMRPAVEPTGADKLQHAVKVA